MPAGQPTKYSPEMQDIADEYLVDYQEKGDPTPSVVGMAVELGVCERTLYNWGDSNPEFLQTLTRCQQIQHRKLLAGGLNSDFNAAITKLMLANHGYHDKSDHTLGGPDGKPIEHDWTITVHDVTKEE